MKVSSCLILLLITAAGFVPVAKAQTDVSGSRKVVSRVMPIYPTVARNLNLSGSVKVEAVVAANGSVKSVQILGGNPVFAEPAETAIRSWKWEKSEHETTERVEVKFTP